MGAAARWLLLPRPTTGGIVKLRMSIPVATAIVLALALVASACSTRTEQSAPKPTVTVTVTASAFPTASPIVAATLPVHVLPTGQDVAWSAPFYPRSVTVRLPRKWAGQVAAYGVAGAVLLAPARWTGQGIGQPERLGSMSAAMHNSVSAAIRGQLRYLDVPDERAFSYAASYFPWVRRDWPHIRQLVLKFGGFTEPLPATISGLTEHLVGNQVAIYSVASGPEVDRGLQVNGVVRTTLAPGDYGEPGFDRLEVALPPSDHALATAILNYYLSPSSIANLGVCDAMQVYFGAINSRIYSTAWGLFTPRLEQAISIHRFAAT